MASRTLLSAGSGSGAVMSSCAVADTITTVKQLEDNGLSLQAIAAAINGAGDTRAAVSPC